MLDFSIRFFALPFWASDVVCVSKKERSIVKVKNLCICVVISSFYKKRFKTTNFTLSFKTT